jgi:site-specific DNA-methyltransferase (adenine-specific)
MAMKYQPAKIHESVLVFGKNTVVYNPIKWYVSEDKIDKRKTVRDPDTNKDGYMGSIKRTRKKDDGSRFPKSIIKIPNPNNNTLHPTQKPVDLFEYLIKTYSNEGDTVLDCCAGSGTTGVACNNTNRKYILIEKEKDYYDTITNRLK